ncbi:MAG: PHP domain-containing protein, partial [Acidimicrobiia bacterium]
MAVDLHSHSTASDGSERPSSLVEKAAKLGLSTLALTDHDTLEGIEEARKAADHLDVELIAGAELSLDHVGGMHLVVLWLEPGPGPLQDRLASLQNGRTLRNAEIVHLLAELGMPLTIDEIADESGSGSVGRPHIAAVMMRKGYVQSIAEAFELWLEPGPGPLQDRLASLQNGRTLRNAEIVHLLAELGMPLTIDEIADESGSGSVGRPHIAAVMMRKGYVQSIA